MPCCFINCCVISIYVAFPRVVCILLREYYVVVSYTLMRCSLQPTPQSLCPSVCLNVNKCKTLLMDVVLWCIHFVSNGVTSGCSIKFDLQYYFSSCLLGLVHFIIVRISLRVLCGCFIGSDVMLQA